jgi:hypothetical protein
MKSFDNFSAELLLLILSFVSALDNYKIAVSRRLVYLIDELHRLRPELVVSSSASGGNPDGIVARALSKLSSRPNIMFAFYTGSTPRKDWVAAVEMQMPKDTVVLAARSRCIQTNTVDEVSSKEDLSIMVGSFPEAKICPFSISSSTTSKVPYHLQIESELLKLTPPGDDHQSYWKVFTIYVSGEGAHYVDDCIQELQKLHPNASIIGGICEGGDVRMSNTTTNVAEGSERKTENDEFEVEFEEDCPKSEEEKINNMSVRQLKGYIIKHHKDGSRALLGVTEKNELRAIGLVASGTNLIENKRLQKYNKLKKASLKESTIISCSSGVFGVALGGNVPLRSIVSRGVRSVLRDNETYKIHKSNVVKPGDEKFPYHSKPGDGMKSQNIISSICCDNGSAADSTTTMSGPEFLYSCAIDRGFDPHYIGVRQTNEDGYTLHQVHRGTLVGDSIIVEKSDDQVNNELDGSDIDLFQLDGPSCIVDLDRTLIRLKEQLVGEQLLGALMFSCGGRGPSKRGMMGEEMMDATHFNNHFNLPCLGFYAGGEIGPMAKADNKNVFQKGKVALQGFTVVFGVFVVPILDTKYLKLDDSEENCNFHLKKKLKKTSHQ